MALTAYQDTQGGGVRRVVNDEVVMTTHLLQIRRRCRVISLQPLRRLLSRYTQALLCESPIAGIVPIGRE